ncbi:MAG: nicotinate-nucleotide adenylyltransferase [Gammaproteobacteria bacterium]|nr:nicotinate-nucleotide adenylyltransferase [Gammaproteobacteria bacterium]
MIGVYGGTFDPVHFGHLRPALDVLEVAGLEEIRFIPCGQPPHREAPLTDAQHRLAMLRLAIARQPGFKIDEREIHRHGPSYMVDTLRELRDEFGAKPLSLILGFDAFLELDTWHEWEQIPDLANLIITRRPGWDEAGFRAKPALDRLVKARQMSIEKLEQYQFGGLCFVSVTQLNISASLIRELIQQGRDVHYLLPDSVYELIKQEKLYGIK